MSKLLALPTLLLLLLASTAVDARVIKRMQHRRALFDVAAACKTTSYPLLCQSLPADSASLKDLTSTVVSAAADKAKEAQDEAAKLMAEPETSNTVSQSLGVCRANFDSAVDSLRGAAKNLKEAASHADLMSNLSAATAFVETCNDAFAERGLKSPVAKTTELLGKLVSNCLDLGSALQ
ncbi:uncharacterized protein LOC122001769 [Zingiber officinale]|uniref:Pectinesterase inhibitor domain-containing protein n=1 Tax=Zingiber officinale TaxID=94328 RepID=A0A8J5LVH1_ZINOF|nr:uncharacterized protein LOC122001769 [Zingiber officinale]KAG6536898.1 hypothetical protein ZIOFF_001974 [Zingiber officinale]